MTVKAYVEVKDEGRGILNDYPYDVCDLNVAAGVF